LLGLFKVRYTTQAKAWYSYLSEKLGSVTINAATDRLIWRPMPGKNARVYVTP